ncbi:MAG: hypothetical protein ACXACP_04030 [Candidatus Hodarchaeales archaeon]
MNTQVGDRLIHCKACGSSISVNTPIKVNNKGHQHSISIKKMDRRSKHGKISSRLVKLQKKEKRDLTKTQFQERSQIELQQQIALSLNQEYMKRQTSLGTRHQNIHLDHIKLKNEEEKPTSKITQLFSLIPKVVNNLGIFRVRRKKPNIEENL